MPGKISIMRFINQKPGNEMTEVFYFAVFQRLQP